MVELADRRKIADLDEPHRQQPRLGSRDISRDQRQPLYEDRRELHGQRQSRFDNMEELQDRRQPQFEPRSLLHHMSRPLQEVRQPELEDRYRLNNTGAWRGDEYLLAEERQSPEHVGRRRRVSFADDRQYFDVRYLRSSGATLVTDMSRSNAVEKSDGEATAGAPSTCEYAS
jgi:hypothetical protein